MWLPDALVRKFPKAAADWKWQGVFPLSRWRDHEGPEGRYHLHETVVQRAVTHAAAEAGMGRRGNLSHIPAFLRHALLEWGVILVSMGRQKGITECLRVVLQRLFDNGLTCSG